MRFYRTPKFICKEYGGYEKDGSFTCIRHYYCKKEINKLLKDHNIVFGDGTQVTADSLNLKYSTFNERLGLVDLFYQIKPKAVRCVNVIRE